MSDKWLFLYVYYFLLFLICIEYKHLESLFNIENVIVFKKNKRNGQVDLCIRDYRFIFKLTKIVNQFQKNFSEKLVCSKEESVT